MKNITLAITSLIIAVGVVHAPSAWALEAPADCRQIAGSATPVVADRAEQAAMNCSTTASESTIDAASEASKASPTLAQCVSDALSAGFRPADRIEHEIRTCLTPRTARADTP